MTWVPCERAARAQRSDGGHRRTTSLNSRAGGRFRTRGFSQACPGRGRRDSTPGPPSDDAGPAARRVERTSVPEEKPGGSGRRRTDSVHSLPPKVLGCVGKAVTPRRLGVRPRMVPKSPSGRAAHHRRFRRALLTRARARRGPRARPRAGAPARSAPSSSLAAFLGGVAPGGWPRGTGTGCSIVQKCWRSAHFCITSMAMPQLPVVRDPRSARWSMNRNRRHNREGGYQVVFYLTALYDSYVW